MGAGSARPNPKMGASDPVNPLFLEFSVTMVSDHGLGRCQTIGGVGVDLETLTYCERVPQALWAQNPLVPKELRSEDVGNEGLSLRGGSRRD